jgi:hypothetical protein
MNRVLSLLLLVPFLFTQILFVTPAFALRGGPFDAQMSRSASALAGTYGVALTGDSLTYNWKNNAQSTSSSNVTGVVALSIPAVGLATGRVLLFKQGLMYMGTAQGVTDLRNSQITLLSQLSHYFVRINTNGVTQVSGAVVDSIYSGQINLALSLNYFSGLVEASGDARFSQYNPQVTSSVTATVAATTSSGTLTYGGNSDPGTATTTTIVTTGSSTTTVGNTTNSTTTTTTTTKTSNDTKAVSTVQGVTDQQTSSDQLDLYLTATGVRQSTTASTIATFGVPSATTSFQINPPAAAAATGN